MIEEKRGDLLDQSVICHQANSVSKTGRGLARAIFIKRPWANLYREREKVSQPGTVVVHKGPNGQKVYHLVAQVLPGRVGHLGYMARGKNLPVESKAKRLEWFKQCLQILSDSDEEVFNFPYRIGCGLAGGHWPDYLSAINTILKDKHVIIWKL